MNIDPYILAFSAVTVIATVFMGFWSAKKSKTAGDFFVAGRSVSVGWNASAISGEYLSAASFMGVAGMVMSSGYDALWYPVCYACGYLFLLLFIAGPLRRFGAYTIPDFAEGRFDSPLFRKIAVCFVLFIGFFYTMPQMKGAGTTLAYIFPGLPYWAGVVLVGAVITLNVALGGMKGITLVQAFQYWAKMFAISVPIFVLMAVYGHYGKQLGANGHPALLGEPAAEQVVPRDFDPSKNPGKFHEEVSRRVFRDSVEKLKAKASGLGWIRPSDLIRGPSYDTTSALANYADHRPSLNDWCTNYYDQTILNARLSELDTRRLPPSTNLVTAGVFRRYLEALFATNGMSIVEFDKDRIVVLMTTNLSKFKLAPPSPPLGSGLDSGRRVLPEKAPADSTWLSPFGPLTTKAAKVSATTIAKSHRPAEASPLDGWREVSGATSAVSVSTSLTLRAVNGWVTLSPPAGLSQTEDRLRAVFGQAQHYSVGNAKLVSVLMDYGRLSGQTIIVHTNVGLTRLLGALELDWNQRATLFTRMEQFLSTNGVALRQGETGILRAMTPEQAAKWDQPALAPVTSAGSTPTAARDSKLA